MKFQLQTIRVKVDRNFEEFAEKKFARCEKFFFNEPSITLTVKMEGDLYVVVANAKSKNGTIFVKEEGNDLNESVERLVKKLKNQAIKTHDKKVDMSHK
ncbi:MAG: HPF/RaiA family ribosome-associated protein [Candidatus Ratteibacteria bacterium]|jgi:ribosomal subunit interface protein